MNKKLLLLISCIFAIYINAQNEFKTEWATKVSVKPEWNAYNEDLSLVLVGDLKEIEMLDGTNGKSIWKFNVKEKLGVKSLEDWFFLSAKEGEPVQLIYKKPKEDQKISLFLNPRTGAVDNAITEASLKDKVNNRKTTKSRARFASRAYDQGSGTFLDLYYKDKLLKNSSSGNEFQVNVNASVGYSWSTPLKIKAVTHLNRLLLSDDEPDVMMNLMIANDKVFVIYEGISVLDLKTGKFLWNTTFDNVQSGATSQEIGRSPLPVVDKDAVYICDFSKGEKVIKKLDINSGAVLWRSDKLSNDDVVSQLFVANNVLIAKFGGYVRKAKAIYNPNSGATTQKAKYDYEGDSDIRSYDAQSGKLLWSAEKIAGEDKFSRSECSVLFHNNSLLACSNKFFYIIDPSTGNVTGKSDISSKEIGKPQSLFVNDGAYIVEGEKGLASYSASGKQNYNVSTGKRLFTEFKGNAFIVWTGKDVDDMNEFIRFDLVTGKITGKLKDCYRPRFDTSGDFFLRFNDQKVVKYKTSM